MLFAPEPQKTRQLAKKIGVLLLNFGSPKSPTRQDLRSYLSRFLSDQRVVELPAWKWQPILQGIILNTRPQKSADKYRSIWTEHGSPLAHIAHEQVNALQTALGDSFHVALAMRYSEPFTAEVLDTLRAQGCERFLILPMYPQYAASSSASALDEVFRYALRCRDVPELRTIREFCEDEQYIFALAENVRESWETTGRGEHIVFSFHGIPKQSSQLGDPYYEQCVKTSEALARALSLSSDEYSMCFQSRFGREEWLQPYLIDTLTTLRTRNISRIDILCPGFTADCLETLEEIAIDAKETFLHLGGEYFQYIPCLNTRPTWINALKLLILRHTQGWTCSTQF